MFRRMGSCSTCRCRNTSATRGSSSHSRDSNTVAKFRIAEALAGFERPKVEKH